jgi:Asp-tRNA(Asn)/Glu-tRNA(Gln) amidotransferase A subunit family amidase
MTGGFGVCFRTMDDRSQPSIGELAARLRAGRLSAVALCEDCVGRIEQLNRGINAVVALDIAGARAAAAASDERIAAGTARGPLEGIPCLVKDNLLVRGMPATWGSRLFAHFMPEADEAPVARLRATGAVILGKTNLPEFAMRGFTANPVYGATRNPWDMALTPGGSSGGSAAAVAAGLVPFSLATDGGGSIRRPAAHTGLVGLKPGLGRIARAGGFPEINFDFEVVGPIVRRVDDARLVFEALAGASRQAGSGSSEPPSARTILCVETIGDAPLDPAIRASFREAVAQLVARGHRVVQAPLPFDIAPAGAAMAAFQDAGLALLSQRHQDFFDKVSAPYAQAARRGLEARAADLMQQIDAVSRFRVEVETACAPYDAIVMPATAAQPWAAEQEYPDVIDGHAVGPRGHAVFTGWVNGCGRPAIAVPIAPAPDGMPIGLQLVAGYGGESLLFELASEIEAHFNGPERWPPLAARSRVTGQDEERQHHGH